jgi:hypothetical protein
MRYAIAVALILLAGMASAKEPGKWNPKPTAQSQCLADCQGNSSCAKKCLGR